MASEEQILLKAFIDKRSDFDKYGPYILSIKNLDRSLGLMLGFIKNFYDKYPTAVNIPESEFRLFVNKNDVFNFVKNNDQYIKSIFSLNLTNNDLKMDVIEHILEKHFMAVVVDKAALVLNNNKSGVLSDIQQIIDEYHAIIRNPPQDFVEYKLNLKQLLDKEVRTKGIPFINETPNEVIGGMREGQLGLFYAYVDTGKTSYGVSNLCSTANHLQKINSERPAIYGCNEEDVSRVSLRAIQCMTGMSSEELAKKEKLVKSIITKKGFDKIHFIDHVNTIRIVEKLLNKYNPRVFFIDQGTKVNLTNSSKEGVAALEETFNILRDMAKRYHCTIICMAQGGDGAAEKQYLTLRDIYGSKSALQGELDFAVGIGVNTSDIKYAGWRYFNITKNKGDKGSYVCRFDSQRCQFKEVS